MKRFRAIYRKAGNRKQRSSVRLRRPSRFFDDVLSEGGASGSPIFRTDDPRVIGVLHAGFDGAPITYAVPGHLLKTGLDAAIEGWRPNLDRVPKLPEIVAAERPSGLKPFE